jgi:hypothetical protein
LNAFWSIIAASAIGLDGPEERHQEDVLARRLAAGHGEARQERGRAAPCFQHIVQALLARGGRRVGIVCGL